MLNLIILSFSSPKFKIINRVYNIHSLMNKFINTTHSWESFKDGSEHLEG